MTDEMNIQTYEAVQILSELIKIPSFSKEEDQTAAYLINYLSAKGLAVTSVGNNLFAVNKFFDESKPTTLLNSHHDTVKPNGGYTKNPFLPMIEDGKLFGLGSNDAGGSLVTLLMTFLHFYPKENLKYNLVFAATAEEEISGANGIEVTLPHLPKINFAIVGEPTKMQMAVAERGLIVLDCIATGKAAHAAREEGDNAIYKAMNDIDWIRNYRFEKVSDLLGAVKLSVTSIETQNKAHNVVPDLCSFIVDVRVNELYTQEEILETVKSYVQSTVTARSTRLRSSSISLDHPIVKSGLALNKTYYGSPTTSDKALMPFPSLKMGPGDSARSHTADEFIYIDEIEQGIQDYIKLLEPLLY